MIVSRRSFLGLFAAAAAARIVVPAFTPPREPYVRVGEHVAYVGLNLHPAPTFLGDMRVSEIGAWDGLGYPVTLAEHGFPGPASMAHRFYDCDLSNFRRDLPDRFWHDPARVERYPNVHAYVREQRFGEDPAVMRRRLGLVFEPYPGTASI